VTHILYVKVSNQPSSDLGNCIRQAIFNAIANTPIQKIVNGHAIAFTWRTRARYTSAYYHCDADFYNDKASKSIQRYCLEIC
jgi:hypothetical protein